MFRAMFSPVVRSTWVYLQYLVVFTQAAAEWCLGRVSTKTPAGSYLGEYYQIL